MGPRDDRIVFRLTGAEAQHGLPLANVAAFVDHVRRALRDFDRQRQGARTSRGGHPTSREELVTAFRLVEFKPGSAIMELEAMTATEVGDKSLGDVESLAVENLRAFMDSLEGDDVVEPAVTDAVEAARRTLGNDGRIEITIGTHRRRPNRRVVIDADRVAKLEGRGR